MTDQGAVKLGNNQSITQEEAEALEAISKLVYEIEFALIQRSVHRNMGQIQRSVWI